MIYCHGLFDFASFILWQILLLKLHPKNTVDKSSGSLIDPYYLLKEHEGIN